MTSTQRRAIAREKMLAFFQPGMTTTAGLTALGEAIGTLCGARSAAEGRARRVEVLRILAREWGEELDIAKFKNWEGV
ncbi:MAG: hypothetical protein IPK73_08350 [Candidatus Obscuribacter sp.]|nr:hypothetical protein [Candidatus Obscuribacter sp.]MBK9279613.1 hypothetical protein [Candidatus Obscuribacter sp.]